MKTILFILAFAAGIWASDGVIKTYRLLSEGWLETSCLPDQGICVGDRLADKKFAGLFALDKTGGLGAVFCEGQTPGAVDKDILFVDDIILGKRCEGEIRGFELLNSTTRTVVRVTDGVVTEIERGPLHALDL